MLPFETQPVFISGYNKSGTTLMLSLLDSHQELSVFPEELHFFNSLAKESNVWKAISTKSGFRLLMDDTHLEAWSEGKSWFEKGYQSFDGEAFGRAIKAHVDEGLSSKVLLAKAVVSFTSLLSSNIECKQRWVSKTTQDEILFPIYRSLYPGSARFVYMIRDPRDVYTSMAKRRDILGAESDSIEFLLNFVVSWQCQVGSMLGEQKDDLVIIKYEDLLVEPRERMKQVTDFLGLAWDDCLLRATRMGESWGGNSVHNESFEAVSTAPIGRYKDALGKIELAIIQEFLANEMSALGYARDPVDTESISSLMKLRYWRKFINIRMRYKIKQFYYWLKFKVLGS